MVVVPATYEMLLFLQAIALFHFYFLLYTCVTLSLHHAIHNYRSWHSIL